MGEVLAGTAEGCPVMVDSDRAGVHTGTNEHRRRLFDVERGLLEDVEYDSRVCGIGQWRSRVLCGGEGHEGPVSVSGFGDQPCPFFSQTAVRAEERSKDQDW